jgi:2-iminoacetate synthase
MSLVAMTLSAHAADFVAAAGIAELLNAGEPDPGRINAVLAKSLAKEALDPAEAAVLLLARKPAARERIQNAARQLKRTVYGNRIVLFAPLYVGNECINDCAYCGFKRSNRDAVRRTLDTATLTAQVAALEAAGHKRLILVFGEHPHYDADFIAAATRQVYAVRHGRDEIRRVNINAAPLDADGYRAVKAAGIGTYQVFQETYHQPTYARLHPAGTRKADFAWRLDALSRAFDGGVDDVGIGALFGLYDCRFETLALVAHARFLQERHGVGPHTISFPRLQPAQGVSLASDWLVADGDFLHLIAVLRLAVPYTGLILTAREPPALRRAALAFGVSQIDAGSRLELGGYTETGDAQVQRLEREQFRLGDPRPLDAVMRQLLEDGYLPSFCTACYRAGRTGEHFMEFAIPGFIKRFCTPNALLTLQEYLCDYASPATRAVGERLIETELTQLPDDAGRRALTEKLAETRAGKRDLHF